MLSTEGEVWGFGSSSNGQLGIDSTESIVTPIKVEGIDEKIVDIVTGGYCSLVRTITDKFLGFGSNNYGFFYHKNLILFNCLKINF